MKIIAGNFKSNLTRGETLAYLRDLDKKLESLGGDSADSTKGADSTESRVESSVVSTDSAPQDSAKTARFYDNKIYIFPATSSLSENNYKHITLGAQNCHNAVSGAFTGEITLSHLEEFGIRAVLVGHSERREFFGESDEICAQKFKFFKNKGLEVFYCIGEGFSVREKGETMEFLKAQLSHIDLNYERLIIAYEPLWAIGTGLSASTEQISEIVESVRALTNAPILYGGSVNADNASEILRVADGVLVGSASLATEKFYPIILRSIE